MFDQNKIRHLDRSSQSPNLNIIEPVWETLEKRLAGKIAANVAEKFNQLEAECGKFDQMYIDKFIDSMPRRCWSVNDAKGSA